VFRVTTTIEGKSYVETINDLEELTLSRSTRKLIKLRFDSGEKAVRINMYGNVIYIEQLE
jgi:hypothetical protein